jgi:hypothetical protein
VAEASEVKLPEVMAVEESRSVVMTGDPAVTPCTESTSIEGLPAVPTSA